MIIPLRISPARLNSAFVNQVEQISAQKMLACYQCGNCSAGCPVADHMDILPNQIIRMVQLGMREQLINSKAIWTCVSCLTCNSRCPKNVRIAEVIEAVREIVLRTNQRQDYLRITELSPEAMVTLPPIALISSMRKLTS